MTIASEIARLGDITTAATRAAESVLEVLPA